MGRRHLNAVVAGMNSLGFAKKGTTGDRCRKTEVTAVQGVSDNLHEWPSFQSHISFIFITPTIDRAK